MCHSIGIKVFNCFLVCFLLVVVVVGLFVGWLVVFCFLFFFFFLSALLMSFPYFPTDPFTFLSSPQWEFIRRILLTQLSQQPRGHILPCNKLSASKNVLSSWFWVVLCVFFFFVFCSFLRAYLKLDFVVDLPTKKHKKPLHFQKSHPIFAAAPPPLSYPAPVLKLGSAVCPWENNDHPFRKV